MSPKYVSQVKDISKDHLPPTCNTWCYIPLPPLPIQIKEQESLLTQKHVHVSKQRLPVVLRHKLDLRLDPEDSGQRLRTALQNLQLRSLGIQFYEVYLRDLLLSAQLVQRNALNHHFRLNRKRILR